MVCLHGLGRTPSDWDGVRAGLERFGVVRTPDIPGTPSEALAHADAAIEAGDIVIGHSMGGVLALRLAAQRPRPLRALILTGCFFPPARNGRRLASAVGDYASHRAAFIRETVRGRSAAERSGGSARALATLVRLGVRPADFDGAMAAVGAPGLIVHARDDHHVPLDFALAAVVRHPEWMLRILDRGGHHAHVEHSGQWLGVVAPWLRQLPSSSRSE